MCGNGRHATSSEVASSFDSLLPLVLRLGGCDVVNVQPDTALGDDVRHAVAALDGDDGGGAGEAEHWKHIHDRVGAPADDCDQLTLLDQARDGGVLLSSCGISQADEQSVNDVQ